MDKFDAILPILLILITLLNTIIGIVKGKKKKEQAAEISTQEDPVQEPERVSVRENRDTGKNTRNATGKNTAFQEKKEILMRGHQSKTEAREKTEIECAPMQRRMLNRDEVRKAFILSEILNRKYL